MGYEQMRGTFVYRNGELIPKCLAEPPARGPRSNLACPSLVRDGIDDLVGMHDGRIYDSKSTLRASYRAQGFRELGNDTSVVPTAPSRPQATKDDIGEAIRAVRGGYKPEIEFENQAPNQTGWSNHVDIE